jgi:signal transduction histidine kinase
MLRLASWLVDNRKVLPASAGEGKPAHRLRAVEGKRSISARLLAGLLFGVAAITIYSGYTISQVRVLSRLQTEVIDRNRRDSLLLVRIQNNLNQLGLAMRDMLDDAGGYPVTAWRSQFRRLRGDLEDAVALEAEVAPASRTREQAVYLQSSMAQFWDAVDRMFDGAARNEAEARQDVRLSLQARQASLTTAVSRYLVQNHESDERALVRTHEIQRQVERNLYLFLAATVGLLALVSGFLIRHNRRVFDRMSSLSERRSELARQLISVQESTFRSISRELHDDFGQILTAVGTLLQRSRRLAATDPTAMQAEIREVHEVVQSTLGKVRSLSQALHPMLLEATGVESAIDAYLPVFQRQTGIAVHVSRWGAPWTVERDRSVHLYRVLQEALNNVARHSGATNVEVRIGFDGDQLTMEIEDNGRGFSDQRAEGLGLVSMRERAEIAGGAIEFLQGASGGVLVRFTVPASKEETHVSREA